MKSDIHFYRCYYSKISSLFLGVSLVILVGVSVCAGMVLLRREPAYYASRLNGMLSPLEPIKVEVNPK